MQENLDLILAENGEQGLELAKRYLPDAILLDLMMPDMTGYEVCKKIRANPKLTDVPIIMITANDNRESRIKGLEAGADDFLTKPFDSLEIQIRVKNILRLNRFQNITNQRDELIRMNEALLNAYDKTIEGWSQAVDLRDHETEGHTLRVTEATLKLAKLVGVDKTTLEHMRRGALLHDIGKLGIPDSILHKPGKLTEEEWKLMRLHPVYAYRLLSPIQYLEPAMDIPYCHHEDWNGKGYPQGLAGLKIPLAARIFSIVDVWDALRSDRPYRKAWPEDEVRAYILEHKSIEFDPDLADLFLDNF